MDVIFEPHRGRPFSIEIGFFDTVLEIKEKVQKYQGIPVHRQTLVLNGRVLEDERDVEYCEIFQNSHIQLFIAPDKPNSQSQPQLVENEQSSPSKNIHLPPDMDIKDTVLHLKKKVKTHEVESIPVNKLVVQSGGGAEVQDRRSLYESELMNNSEVDVSVKPSPTSSGGTGSKKLKLMVLPKCGTRKIPVEVNASDNVGDLRKELQKLQENFHFHLPEEGYFFIYKQNVMDDDRSFRWHHVGSGDTIEIFNGSVTEFSMEVIIEPERGSPFSLQIGFFDKVLEIKEKVEKYRGIPVNRQTLILNGNVLQDERDVQYCQIFQDSHIQLLVAPDQSDKSQSQSQSQLVTSGETESHFPFQCIEISMDVIIEPERGSPFSIEIGLFDRVLEIKEKIQIYKGIPVQRQTLVLNGNVLQDERDVAYVEIFQDTHIQLFVAPHQSDKPQSQSQPQLVTSGKSESHSPFLRLEFSINVIFEPERGSPFSIEIGFFDTVLEIKEKIQKYQGIPIQRQTLVLNGNVLQDEHDVAYCDIFQDSHIQLLVAPDHSDKTPSQSQPQLVTNEQSSSSKNIHPPPDMDINDTILHLKKKGKIHEVEPTPVNSLVVQSSGAASLGGCELKDNSEVNVNLMPPPKAAGSGGTCSKKLKVIVLTRCDKKIPVEVNASDKVEELRKELEKLQERFHFQLPEDGYFFIHKQTVMDDDMSFWWHLVRSGDTIEIFPGRVSSAP
ncbi:polyubiquitin 8-like [Mangifera indica]|uniref:polyubiquitin 8-like n=1 Tax=Mangifera indica TaxID=29780 RepID=UPI001CF94353|nr:polyubiquitin 8-like [Mangifera indica]